MFTRSLMLLLFLGFSSGQPIWALGQSVDPTQSSAQSASESGSPESTNSDSKAHSAGRSRSAKRQAADGTKLSQFEGAGAAPVQDPAFHETVAPGPNSPAAKPTDSPGAGQPASSSAAGQPTINPDGLLKRAVIHFPRTAASFTTGVLVGTPIAMARKSKQQIIEMTKDMTADSSNPLYTGIAASWCWPFGIWSGTIDGAISSVKNSALYSVDNPFSKSSFSLGELR